MVKTQIEEVSGRALAKSEKLKNSSDLIRKVVVNSRGWDRDCLPEQFRGSVCDYRRLVLNNEELGFDGTYTYSALQSGDLDYGNASRVVYRLAEKGDPLCIKMLEFLNGDSDNVYSFRYGICSKITAKIIGRTLTQEEYEGYLEGKLSVHEKGFIDKESVFL